MQSLGEDQIEWGSLRYIWGKQNRFLSLWIESNGDTKWFKTFSKNWG